jgi:class 3 adenylate cyclase
MRAYFTAMQRAIRKHKGLVLQYVGDEIEAAFGVPIPYDGHADKAILAALEMRKNLKELNKERVKEGKVSFRHGIGIHTGEVLVGNTGSEDQPSYALIGETVNLASRLQGLNKEFGTETILSESTRSRLAEANLADSELKELPATKVKGKSRSVEIFALE